MELDVHLERTGAESWGFRLIGGTDFAMPLTVVKVVPNSPAATAGLCNGDAVCRVNGTDAGGMSHDDAKRCVAEADQLTLGVKRGLYDPVLDDYEPIYETIDPEDFDQPSQPTEVDPFKIQQFVDPSEQDLRRTPGGLPELRDIETPRYGTPGLYGTQGSNGTHGLNGTPGINGFDQSRSLTASPFVLPTKPYRPFSTEPLPDALIPPLEDPIILNPNYKDQFGKLGNGSDGEIFLETRFKLPISEQYDPDGTRKKKKEGSVMKEGSVVKEVKFAEETKTTKDASEVKYTSAELKQQAVEDKKFMETMKKEIDLDKIEMTAISLVDESIERAVSVTDEIKQEIDVALRESSISKVEQSKTVAESSMISSEISSSERVEESAKSSKITKEKSRKEATELVQLIDKTTEEITSYNDQKAEISVAKEVQKFEKHEKREEVVDERKLSTKQEIEETIEVGSVRRKSEVFDKKVDSKSAEQTEKVDKKTAIKAEKHVQKQEEVQIQPAVDKTVNKVNVDKYKETQVKLASEKDVQNKATKAETIKEKTYETKKESVSSQKTGVRSSTTSSSAKLQSDHTKAYLIGLQTIPNIKGTITSSYHYNLLLKTFFIHLTDVMVALSRFILTEPALYKTEESQNIVAEESATEYKTYTDEREVFDEKHDVVERKRSVVKEAKAMEVQKEEEAVAVQKIETKKEIKKAKEVMAVEEKVADYKEERSVTKAQVTERIVDHHEEAKAVAQEVVVEAIEERRYKDEMQENFEVEQIMDRRDKLSGAQMAQIQERKSAELTQRMDAVITEFQSRAGIEELETTRERRSRSRSKVEEEVMLESDPLEWLSKQEMQQKEIAETKFESKSFSSVTESTEKKRTEKIEKHEKSSKSKEGKQMYVAIVESHCFTNKDAIFEEQAASFSETSSVVSAEETNIALQASETIATEKVSMESQEIKQEVAETVLEESRELSIVNAQTEAVIQKAEEYEATAVVEETKAIIEEVEEETAVQVDTKVVQEVAIQEVIEPVVEIQEMKSVEIAEDYTKVSVKEEEHVMSVSEKTEISLAETHESLEVHEVKKEEYAALEIEEAKAVEVVKEEIKAVEVVKDEIKAVDIVKEKSQAKQLVKQEIKKVEYKPPPIQEVTVECRVVQRARSKTPVYQEASAALTIVKPAKTPIEEKQELIFSEQSDVSITKQTEIIGSDSEYAAMQRSKMESYEETEIQESTFTARSAESYKSKTIEDSSSKASESTAISLADQKSNLKLDLRKQASESSIPSTISTPTPATVPPTPLTDEYVFKLKAPMPKEDGTPIPRDCTPTPEDEDPNIVKKKLIPYIDTILESPVIFDPPLPSPPLDKPTSPVYSKPGLKGGCERSDFRREEILEIERKSSLLASAIDETIKSIEEYKEEVGIDTKKEVKVEETTKFEKSDSKIVEEHTVSRSEVTVKSSSQPIIYNGFAKVETKVYDTLETNKIEEEWNKIDKKIKESNNELTELSNNIDVEVDVTLKVNDEVKYEVDYKLGTDKRLETIEVKTELEKDHTSSVEVKLAEVSKDHKTSDITAEFIIKSGSMPSVTENGESTAKEQRHKVSEKKTVKTESVEITEITNGISEPMEEPKVNGKFDEEMKMNGVTEDMPLKTEFLNGTQEPMKPETTNGDIPKAVIEKPPPMFAVEDKKDPMAGYRPIQFDPEEIMATKRNLQSIHLSVQPPSFQRAPSPSYVDSKGELLGTHQGIVDGLEEAVMDAEVAKELGKPGLTEQKIAELISGESEMLREAHVMGLSRVLKSHMHRADDDSSVDFKKIKPILNSLKDSEVLKALNEEIERAREEKRKEEEKKWTKFLQKPKRPVPKAKFGYPGWVQEEEVIEEPYKVKIVKQPKPKVAPDYKPKNFETGPLPWEERALNEPPPPPVEAEEPILIPEELPEFLEAVDPLPESEVPDLEDTGIPLPPPEPAEEESPPSPALIEDQPEEQETEEAAEELDLEAVVEETEKIVVEMEQNRLAEQLLMGVQSMIDPNAPMEQQLAQMRAQMAALAQLPSVIQQTLDAVSRQLSHLSQAEGTGQMMITEAESQDEMRTETQGQSEVNQNNCEIIEEETTQEVEAEQMTNGEESAEKATIVEVVEEVRPSLTQEEMEKLKKEEEEMLEEQRRVEKQKKELMDQMKIEQESRQVKQRPTPRVGKPKQVFGPPTPVARPLVLPGGRKWRKPEDAYNETFIKETLSAQMEQIQGKTMGINFMKYEKPPVSLDHLQHSETYKLIHNMEQTPVKRVELRTPVIAEADYREKCRSVTPTSMIPQQVHP